MAAPSAPLPIKGLRSAPLAQLEACLFAARDAITLRKLVKLARLNGVEQARTLIDELNQLYDQERTAFRVEELAGGFLLLTRPQWRHMLDQVMARVEEFSLTPATLETLAIIAYRQPIGRADVEAIRGVHVTEQLHVLMDKGLVRIVGQQETLGRPYLYGVTNLFLTKFGLRRLEDLPLRDTLRPTPTPLDRDREDDEDPRVDEEE